MRTTCRMLGVYQVVAGAYSLAALWPLMSPHGVLAVAALFLFSVLSIIAGVAMWRNESNRWSLTIINQLPQTIGFYSPAISFFVIHGASLTVFTGYLAKASFAESVISHGFLFSAWDAICNLFPRTPIAGTPDYGVSLNLFAVGILLFCLFSRRKANQSPQPVPSMGG